MAGTVEVRKRERSDITDLEDIDAELAPKVRHERLAALRLQRQRAHRAAAHALKTTVSNESSFQRLSSIPICESLSSDHSEEALHHGGGLQPGDQSPSMYPTVLNGSKRVSGEGECDALEGPLQSTAIGLSISPESGTLTDIQGSCTRRDPVHMDNAQTMDQSEAVLEHKSATFDRGAPLPPSAEACVSADTAKNLLHVLSCCRGCTKDEHSQAAEQHYDDFDASTINHTRLRDIPPPLSTPCFEETMDTATATGLRPAQLMRDFEGRTIQGNEVGEPKSVCIHESHQETDWDGLTSWFDVYCHFGSPLSINAFLEGFRLVLCRPSDEHVQDRRPHEAGSPSSVEPHEPQLVPTASSDAVAGYTIGHIDAIDATIHMRFPRISDPSTLLTEAGEQKLIDRVILPALRASCPPDLVMALPQNYEEFKLRSGQIDAGSANYPTTIDLDAKTCQAFWRNMIQVVEDGADELSEYRGAKLFVTSLGSRYKSRSDSLWIALDRFHSKMQMYYDEDSLGNLFITIGKEIKPNPGGDSQAAFWRKCCVGKMLTTLANTEDHAPAKPGSGNSISTYSHCGLRDLVDFAYKPPSNSAVARDGLIYVRLYSRLKKLSGPTGDPPFVSTILDHLLCGASDAGPSRKLGNAGDDITAARKYYDRSKNDTYLATRGRNVKDHQAARVECRVSYSLFRRIMDVAARKDEATHSVATPSCCANAAVTPLWILPTQEYLDFVWFNVGKCCAVFDKVIARSDGMPDREQTRLAKLMLEMSRMYVQAMDVRSAIMRKMWKTTKSKTTVAERRCVPRTSFSLTMAKYGFSWLPPIVKWGTGRFDSAASHSTLPDVPVEGIGERTQRERIGEELR